MPTPRVGPLGVLSATGSMLYRDANGDVTDVSPGSNGEVLTLVGGVPAWAAASLAVDEFIAFTPSDAIYGAINSIALIAQPGVRNLRQTLEFADDSVGNENIVFSDVMASFYDAANSLEVRIDWAAPAAVVVGDVKWNAAFESLSIGADDIDAESFAADQTVTTAAPGTTGFLARTTIPFTTLQAGSIAAGEDFRLQIVRDAADITDTLVGDADVIRVSIAEV